MSNEIRVQTNLQVVKGSTFYQSRPTAFVATMNGTRGPTPGAFVASKTGTDVDLSELSQMGGLCRIQNLDSTNFITYGLFDTSSFRFYPLGDVLPGESYVLRLSQELGEEIGTGSGTANLGGSTLRIKAHGAACQVLIEAFDY